jgi:hypothetical protein
MIPAWSIILRTWGAFETFVVAKDTKLAGVILNVDVRVSDVTARHVDHEIFSEFFERLGVVLRRLSKHQPLPRELSVDPCR